MARIVSGRAANLGPAVTSMELREPVGAVAVVTPWNWPIQLILRSLAPALAAGNTCVVKPASLTAAVAVESLRLLSDIEFVPDGVVSCVVGPGDVVGDALVSHRGIDMIAFTGESKTGVSVMQRAAVGLRKVTLELGGKSPNVVFGDADLEKAVQGARDAVLTTSGQICTAGSRLLVEHTVYDSVLDRLVKMFEATVVGDPLDPATEMGPLVSRAQRDVVLGYLDIARGDGRVATGGQPLEVRGCAAGSFLSPAIVVDLPRSSPVMKEEIFGPVLVVERFVDEADAIALANDTDFGLAAAVWTSNLNRAMRVARAIRAGTVWVNTYNHFYPEMEVGGRGISGLGHEHGIEGMYEFTELKHVNLDGNANLW